MSTDYYKELTLDTVPTGFGLYTGIKVVNSSIHNVDYKASISSTTLQGLSDNDVNFFENTLFVSSEQEPDGNLYDAEISLSAGGVGYFYVLHKPFANFKSTATPSLGDETASLVIESSSEVGDVDSDIEIFVTGKRVVAFDVPQKVQSFVAQKIVTNSFYALDFNWSCDSPNSYITGFNLFLSSQANFSDNAFQSPYQIPVNTNSNSSDPLYGNYKGLSGFDFSKTILTTDNLLGNQDPLYAKIVPVNKGGDGNPSFCYGINNSFDKVPNNVLDGSFPTPGSDLKFVASELVLHIKVNALKNFDLLKFIYESNNNSYDFRRYSSITVKFSSATDEMGVISSDIEGKPAISFIKPEAVFRYNANSENIFKLNLEFENIKILGSNGRGVTFDSDRNPVAGVDGGDLFRFDNFDDGTKSFHYYILKDYKSIFYAGRGGGKGKIEQINDSQENLFNGQETTFDGLNLENFVNFVSVLTDDDTSVGGTLTTFVGQAGSVGSINSTPDDFPNIYLGFKDRSAFDNDGLMFRFRTDNITANAGTQTNEWIDTLRRTSDNSQFKLENAASVLTVREAYGRKFYELDAAGDLDAKKNQSKAIKGTPIFNVSHDPSYTILVFALATAEAGNFSKMFDLDGASDIHKFTTNTTWGLDKNAQDDFIPSTYYNNQIYAVKNNIFNFYKKPNDGGLCSVFTGSTLNAVNNYARLSWLELDTGGRDDSGVATSDNSLNFRYANPPAKFTANNPLVDPFFIHQNPFSIDENYWLSDGQSRKNRFYSHNLSSAVSNPGNFTLSDDTQYGSFSLFFVKMVNHSVNIGNTNHVIEESFVNGQKVFSGHWRKGTFLQNVEFLIQLHNGSYNDNDNDTKLFLFDYMHGTSRTVAERDFRCDEIMNYLSDYYQPLLLKSASDLLVSRKNGNNNTSIGFDLPLAHPYLNINSKNV